MLPFPRATHFGVTRIFEVTAVGRTQKAPGQKLARSGDAEEWGRPKGAPCFLGGSQLLSFLKFQFHPLKVKL